jgi:hypothetical protein
MLIYLNQTKKNSIFRLLNKIKAVDLIKYSDK